MPSPASVEIATSSHARCAVVALAQSVAADAMPKGVRVNMISPGFIETSGAHGMIMDISRNEGVSKDEARQKVVAAPVPPMPSPVADIAAQNAAQLGHSVALEIKVLVLHGILHLAGFDHERDNGEMARKEAKLRQALNLPVALIERNSSSRKGRRSA